MLVYGVGAHLADMLNWHPELAHIIERVFDKDNGKIGKTCPGLNILVESPEEMKNLPKGSEIAVAAIRFLGEISMELQKLNPGLICRNIDDVYARLDSKEVAGQVGKLTLGALLEYLGADFVERAYEAVLGRATDPQSLKKYRKLLMNGQITRRQIIREMAFSPEGRAKGVTIDGLEKGDEITDSMTLGRLLALPTRQFVECCYRCFLKREPDFGGFDSYMSKLLDNRMGRMDVVRQILSSPEGKSKGGRFHAFISEDNASKDTEAVQEVDVLREKLGDLTVAHKILMQEVMPHDEQEFDSAMLPVGAAMIYRKLRGD